MRIEIKRFDEQHGMIYEAEERHNSAYRWIPVPRSAVSSKRHSTRSGCSKAWDQRRSMYDFQFGIAPHAESAFLFPFSPSLRLGLLGTLWID